MIGGCFIFRGRDYLRFSFQTDKTWRLHASHCFALSTQRANRERCLCLGGMVVPEKRDGFVGSSKTHLVAPTKGKVARSKFWSSTMFRIQCIWVCITKFWILVSKLVWLICWTLGGLATCGSTTSKSRVAFCGSISSQYAGYNPNIQRNAFFPDASLNEVLSLVFWYGKFSLWRICRNCVILRPSFSLGRPWIHWKGSASRTSSPRANPLELDIPGRPLSPPTGIAASRLAHAASGDECRARMENFGSDEVTQLWSF